MYLLSSKQWCLSMKTTKKKIKGVSDSVLPSVLVWVGKTVREEE